MKLYQIYLSSHGTSEKPQLKMLTVSPSSRIWMAETGNKLKLKKLKNIKLQGHKMLTMFSWPWKVGVEVCLDDFKSSLCQVFLGMLYFSAVWGTFHRFSLETSGSALCEGTRLYKEKGGEKITAVYFKFEIEFGWQICENAAHGCVLCGPPTHSHTHTESDIDFDCVGVRWTDWNFASAALSSLSDYSLRWERSRLLFQWTFMSSFYLMCRGWCVAPWSVGWSFFFFFFFFLLRGCTD